MKNAATSVAGYLASLPPDRREAIKAVRRVIRKNIDADIEEGIEDGMIGYYVPHRVYPAGYRADPKQPLPYAALASRLVRRRGACSGRVRTRTSAAPGPACSG
jgi:hypothetical protein